MELAPSPQMQMLIDRRLEVRLLEPVEGECGPSSDLLNPLTALYRGRPQYVGLTGRTGWGVKDWTG